MRGSPLFGTWCRHVLSLVLLTANIGAPFRSSVSGCTHFRPSQAGAATTPVVRVRGLSPSGANLGFRAVVGTGAGGPGRTTAGPTPAPLSAFLPPPADSAPAPHGVHTALPQNPPLRC